MAETSNSTLPYLEIEESIHLVTGLIGFCINFLPLLDWNSPSGKPYFPILLNLCAANTIKSSANYISGMEVLFGFFYNHDESWSPLSHWLRVWLFVGYQAVNWSTLVIAFDRFVSVAYPSQYDDTGILYKAAILGGSWLMTVSVSLVASIYAESNVTFWHEMVIYRKGSPPLVGLFRCLDTACSLSTCVLLLSAAIVLARRAREKKDEKRKWQIKVRVEPPRKKAMITIPLRHPCQNHTEKSTKQSPAKIVTSLYFNVTMWLLPSVISFARTASWGELDMPAFTLVVLGAIHSFHGSVDVIIYTFQAVDIGKKIEAILQRGQQQSTCNSRSGSNTSVMNYHACCTCNNCVHPEYSYMEEFEDGSSFYPY